MHVVRAGFALAIAIALAACGTSTTPATNAPAASSGATPAAASAPASAGTATCAVATLMGAVEVEIEDFAFKPDPIQANVGDTISWTNKDDVPHSAALDDGSCATETINNAEDGSLTFSAPGTYTYHCAIHPTRMKGTIEVSG